MSPTAYIMRLTGLHYQAAPMCYKQSSSGLRSSKHAAPASQRHPGHIQLFLLLPLLLQDNNLLVSYPAFTRFERNGLAACLKFFQGGDQLPPSILDWAFALTKRHMQVQLLESSFLLASET